MMERIALYFKPSYGGAPISARLQAYIESSGGQISREVAHRRKMRPNPCGGREHWRGEKAMDVKEVFCCALECYCCNNDTCVENIEVTN